MRALAPALRGTFSCLPKRKHPKRRAPGALTGYAGPLPGHSYQAVHRLHKREAEADPQLLYAAPYALPYAYLVPGLVAHPNGAVVPLEPADVRYSNFRNNHQFVF